MARNSGGASSKASAAKKSSNSKKQALSPAEKKSNKAQKDSPDADVRIFDERTRRDIVGVLFVLLGIILFIMVVMPSDAVVTSFISQFFKLVFGVGAYVLPFFLMIIGASCLVRFKRQRVPVRVTVGLIMIFIAILAIISLFTPLVPSGNINSLFTEGNLIGHGGYIGAGIAWAGLNLLGQVVSCLLMIGLIIAGLIVIGFSISSFIEKIQDLSIRKNDPDEMTALDSPAYARIENNKERANAGTVNPVDTNVMGKKSKRNHGPRKASTSLNTKILEGGESSTQKAEPAAMTRRLGKKNASGKTENAQDTRVLDKKDTKHSTSLAVPQPLEGFTLPAQNYLVKSTSKKIGTASEAELKETALCLQETLGDFNVPAEVVGWVAGPTVTLFKVDLPSGIRVSRVTALEDDIALALAAPGVRIFAPIPGTNYVGIEVPNQQRQTVLLGDVLREAEEGPLQIAIGRDVEGQAIVSDLAKMPHLLIGGTTGSGKSVSINAMIMSILMRATPAEVRFIMIDPKRVEFTPYNGIPHLYVPVVTEPKEAASALSWGVAEMERRLKIFSKVGARNIGQYNAKVQEKAAKESEDLEAEPSEDQLKELPYIVIIIDELADLMMNVGKEVEFSISRIAQLARAAGIHLIVATQRPSANVVTGLIKANITNRIAFNVASGIDSRVVLDTPGAENLIGLGDLLLSKPEYSKPQRIQGCYVSEDEIFKVVEHLKEQGEPEYHSEILKTNLITLGSSSPDGSGGSGGDDDPLVWEAAEIVTSSGLGSTSNIQRRLKVGYSRAGRIMDMLEEKGIVGPPNGSKPREVLIDELELESLKALESQDAELESTFE